MLVLLAVLAWAVPGLASGTSDRLEAHEASAREAIAAAVRTRMGASAAVSVGDLSGLRVIDAQGPWFATWDPSVRAGTPSRFALFGSARGRRSMRVGEVTAIVNVTVEGVTVRRPVARGARVEIGDVEVMAASLEGKPLKPLPSALDAAGARALRDLVPGALLVAGDIALVPIVTIGESVRAAVHVDGTEVVASLIAGQNGARDDIIRVVNPTSRRAMHARVTGKNEVEVIDVR